MSAYWLVYTFLFIAMGLIIYLACTPWLTLKPRNSTLIKPQEGVIEGSMP